MPTPKPAGGEALIRVKACALNHLDLWIRQGIPAYKVPLPHISGCDIAGVIEEIVPGVEDDHSQSFSPGQAVYVAPGVSCRRCDWCLAGKDNLCSSFKVLGAQVNGGYAEFVVVPSRNVIPMPKGLTFEQAAAFPLVFLTAWHMVFGLARLQPGGDGFGPGSR